MATTASKAEEVDYVLKIVIVGDSGVGKSSMMLQFTDDHFSDTLASTIGVDFKSKVMNVNDNSNGSGPLKVKVIIWDTAGQERFKTLTSSYYRGAQGVILVYDVTRRFTFESLNSWLQEVEQYSIDGGKDVVKLLVGNKVDMQRDIPRDEVEDWARSHGMLFLEASAKTKVGINQVFEEIVHKILQNPALLAHLRQRKANANNVTNLGGDIQGDRNNSAGGICC